MIVFSVYYDKTTINPCHPDRGVIFLFNCKNASLFLLSVSFRTQFRIAVKPRFSLRIFSYLHSSHITFIGLLPHFIFFVKVPFRRWDINHFLRTSLNKFLPLPTSRRQGHYVYVGVSPSFLVFLEVTTVIVVYLLFTYFPFLSSTVTRSE